MMLTISTTHEPATDLGYLLHKHPDRCQSFSLSFGQAHVFYPEAGKNRCTAALLLDVDPVGLVRNRKSGPAGEGGSLQHYVNDRPYVASSFMSVAIAKVYGTAMTGRCQHRPDLADQIMPLEARLAVISCAAGEGLLRELFEPLGYALETHRHPLDDRFPAWGASPYHSLTLRSTTTLAKLLTHLYVLIPVLDNEKHYWVGRDEVDKLLRQGEGWLSTHPKKDLIARRYLRHQSHLTRDALVRLTEEDQSDPDATAEAQDQQERQAEAPLSLHEQRLDIVLDALKSAGAKRVLDAGCGEGKLLRLLLRDKQFESIVGMDVSARALEIAAQRLRLDEMPERQRQRIGLLHGSLMYRDQRLSGFDAAALVEVIEHLDPPRLRACERVLFEFARPSLLVITTPNAEYNSLFPSLPAGQFRHRDHRFEWTRAEFEQWASVLAAKFAYRVRFEPIGPIDPDKGAPTQMGVFER